MGHEISPRTDGDVPLAPAPGTSPSVPPSAGMPTGPPPLRGSSGHHPHPPWDLACPHFEHMSRGRYEAKDERRPSLENGHHERPAQHGPAARLSDRRAHGEDLLFPGDLSRPQGRAAVARGRPAARCDLRLLGRPRGRAAVGPGRPHGRLDRRGAQRRRGRGSAGHLPVPRGRHRRGDEALPGRRPPRRRHGHHRGGLRPRDPGRNERQGRDGLPDSDTASTPGTRGPGGFSAWPRS